MRLWPRDWDKATAGHWRRQDGAGAYQCSGEMNNLGGGRCQDIDRARIRVRVLALDVDDALVFRSFELLRQVRVYRRCSVRVHMHMEKRCAKYGKEKRRYSAAGCQSSHVLQLNG